MEPPSRRNTRPEIVVADPAWHRHGTWLERLAARAAAAAGSDATIVLTNDRTIRALNARDRGRNKPTNVLTYEAPPEILLGLGQVRREALAEQKTVRAHMAHLIVHGALHLAGHDHHHAGDARRMEQAEARILARIGVANPWKRS
jgi:probable rRNA maturation factor